MAKDRIEKSNKTVKKPEQRTERQKYRADATEKEPAGMAGLQQRIGNQAVQRLLAQRSGDGGFDLDDDVAARIQSERGSGQPLDRSAGEKLGTALGADFDDVRVHTTPAADELSHQLGARAFTTGQDIFFREGTYAPRTAEGETLLAHELAHVVQQGAGQVPDSSSMKVNAPDDAFERDADRAAERATGAGGAEAVAQRQEEEEDEIVMTQVEEEEDEIVMTQEEEEEVQLQAEEEEEEPIQLQEIPEEEEFVQTQIEEEEEDALE